MTSPSPQKAREILKDGTVHGKSISNKQKRFFGWIAGGSKPSKTGTKKSRKKMGSE